MNSKLQEIIARYTAKGWTLVDIIDNRFPHHEAGEAVSHCWYCGCRIRYAFKCEHNAPPSPSHLPDQTHTIFVGSECVKSFVDDINGEASVAFLKAKWRQKGRYFWKRFMDRAVIVGTKRDGSWWAAVARSVTDHKGWTFSQRRFDSRTAAQRYVQTYALTGRPPRVLTGADIIAHLRAQLKKGGGQ